MEVVQLLGSQRFWKHQILMGVGDGQEAWRAAIYGVAKSGTRLSD